MRLLCAFLLLASACSNGAADEATLRQAVRDHSTAMAREEAAKTLARLWREHPVVLLGETHYVKEHHAMLGSLLVELAATGRRVLVLHEGIHAHGWLANDYIAGRRDALPERVLDFNEHWLEPVRAFNRGRPDKEQIATAFVDMNHGAEDFVTSIRLLNEVTGPDPILQALGELDPRSEEYPWRIDAQAGLLERDESRLVEEWGTALYARIVDMVNVEVTSHGTRLEMIHETRERIMIGQSLRHIRRFEGMVLINCGMNHAQKLQRIYDHDPLLGTELHRVLDGVFSAAFVPITGEIKRRFFDTETHAIDVIAEAPTDDLVRILAEESEDKIGYLPLTDPLFATPARMHLSFQTNIFPPFEAFDALITYPRVTVFDRLR